MGSLGSLGSQGSVGRRGASWRGVGGVGGGAGGAGSGVPYVSRYSIAGKLAAFALGADSGGRALRSTAYCG